MDYDLTDRIKSSVAFISEDLNENFLAKKTAQTIPFRTIFFRLNCPNLINENGLP